MNDFGQIQSSVVSAAVARQSPTWEHPVTQYSVLYLFHESTHGHLVNLQIAIPDSNPMSINMISAYNTIRAGDAFLIEDETKGEVATAYGVACSSCGEWTLRAALGGEYFDHLAAPKFADKSRVVDLAIARIVSTPEAPAPAPFDMYQMRGELGWGRDTGNRGWGYR